MADERQREQARVHARFTRQRKQELIDKLQSQYNELLNHRLQSELKAHQGVTESRLLKSKVLQLLDMWSDNGVAEEGLLSPEVRALLPCLEDEKGPRHRLLVGVEAMKKGMASVALYQDKALNFAVEVAVDSIFTGSRAAMTPYWYRSHNAVECGASREVELRGMLYCEFEVTEQDATIVGVKVIFDCAAWNRELAAAFKWELPTLSRGPRNLNQAYAAMAAAGDNKPMLLTTLAPPRKIVRVTERYCKMTGYNPRELLGYALMWLDPPSSDQRDRLTELVGDLRRGVPLMAMMQHPTNLPPSKSYDDANGIYTFTQAFPLKSNGQWTHCLWVLREPPEPATPPCVRALLELAVRIARVLTTCPTVSFVDDILRSLESVLFHDDSDPEIRERHVVASMWDIYKHTRIMWSRVAELSPDEKSVTKTLGSIWSHFFAQVRAAGADEPFASFIERAKHYSVTQVDENVSFILRRFASLALNFHRDWVSNGKINDSVDNDRRPEVERALAVYSKVIDTWPKYAEAWNRRARAYFLLGDYDAADADLNEAIDLQPANSSAWVGRMLVYMKQKHYAKALDAYKHAVKLNPALDLGDCVDDL